jgi:uncharacterized damage-inducible protein DinB
VRREEIAAEMKKSLEDYRKGAAGSMMDEYERAAFELKALVQNVPAADYARIIEGESKHCHSIEVIMNHVVRSGYGYSKYIRDALSIPVLPVEERRIPQAEIGREIDKMLAYTAEIFESRAETIEDELENVFFKTRWGVIYNIDQLFEHAIVHVLRHRRQIEKFLLKLKT